MVWFFYPQHKPNTYSWLTAFNRRSSAWLKWNIPLLNIVIKTAEQISMFNALLFISFVQDIFDYTVFLQSLQFFSFSCFQTVGVPKCAHLRMSMHLWIWYRIVDKKKSVLFFLFFNARMLNAKYSSTTFSRLLFLGWKVISEIPIVLFCIIIINIAAKQMFSIRNSPFTILLVQIG